MNAEMKIKELNDEVRALKATYERSASEIVAYTFTATAPETGYVSHTITFRTEDGSNAIASLDNANARRVPFEGGARWITIEIYSSTIRVHSMQMGTISIS